MSKRVSGFLLGCAVALSVWTTTNAQDRPVTFFSAKPGNPVIVPKWAELAKFHPTGWPGKWNGTPCGQTNLQRESPLEFHRIPQGPVVALVPCWSIGDELWEVTRQGFEIVLLPMPSDFPDGGFSLRRNTGHLAWKAEAGIFTATTSSDAVPHLAQRMTYTVGQSVRSVRLTKVESALRTGYNHDNLDWQTEWEAKPWRAQPKGPMLGP
jgi:hypothetical protein